MSKQQIYKYLVIFVIFLHATAVNGKFENWFKPKIETTTPKPTTAEPILVNFDDRLSFANDKPMIQQTTSKQPPSETNEATSVFDWIVRIVVSLFGLTCTGGGLVFMCKFGDIKVLVRTLHNQLQVQVERSETIAENLHDLEGELGNLKNIILNLEPKQSVFFVHIF
jgi:hypothetical protein